MALRGPWQRVDPGPERRGQEEEEVGPSRTRGDCCMLSPTMRTIPLALILTASAYSQNDVTAGRLHVDPPTLENLGFAWSIQGDANRNAKVDVQYKASAETTWRQALPLLRIGGEQVGRDRENLKYFVPAGFAGSILNLKPG